MPRTGRVENLSLITSTAEARERGRKGGQKSAQKRRQDREMREILAMMLQLPVLDGKLDKIAATGDSAGKNYTTSEAIVLAQVQAAMRGDQKALRFVLEFSGQLAATQGTQNDDGFMQALEGAAKGAWDDGGSDSGEVGDVPV